MFIHENFTSQCHNSRRTEARVLNRADHMVSQFRLIYLLLLRVSSHPSELYPELDGVGFWKRVSCSTDCVRSFVRTSERHPSGSR